MVLAKERFPPEYETGNASVRAGVPQLQLLVTVDQRGGIVRIVRHVLDQGVGINLRTLSSSDRLRGSQLTYVTLPSSIPQRASAGP